MIKTVMFTIIIVYLIGGICLPQSINNGLYFGQYAGGTGIIADPFLIETAEQINKIGLHKEHWDKHFKQVSNIDLSIYSGEQFNIIGFEGDGKENFPFTGTFDGNGYEIRNFTYKSSQRGIAMFQLVDFPGELKNITILKPIVDCPQSSGVASLVFMLVNGIVNNCRIIDGMITGGWATGGLVSTYWTKDVPGSGAETAKITNCHVNGQISGTADHTGGLVGISYGRIHKCSFSGSVSGKTNVGGLTSQSGYWVKWNTVKGDISNCYSNCLVSGVTNVGGLVGKTDDSTRISNCYACGEVTGNSNVGGLIGDNRGFVSHSFWVIETSNSSKSSGGKGLSTKEMQNPDTYQKAGWDMVNTWEMKSGFNYPRLRYKNNSIKHKIK